jgi:hypothetical protein
MCANLKLLQELERGYLLRCEEDALVAVACDEASGSGARDGLEAATNILRRTDV